MGSGAAIKAGLKLNRNVLGVELEKDRFEITKDEIMMENIKIKGYQSAM